MKFDQDSNYSYDGIYRCAICNVLDASDIILRDCVTYHLCIECYIDASYAHCIGFYSYLRSSTYSPLNEDAPYEI